MVQRKIRRFFDSIQKRFELTSPLPKVAAGLSLGVMLMRYAGVGGLICVCFLLWWQRSFSRSWRILCGVFVLLGAFLFSLDEKRHSEPWAKELDTVCFEVELVFSSGSSICRCLGSGRRFYLNPSNRIESVKGLVVEGDVNIEPLKKSRFFSYLKNRGVRYSARLLTVYGVNKPKLKGWQKGLNLGRSRFEKGLGDGFSNEQELLTILKGLVLGAELTPELKGRFREAGLLHLFSVSGLHVAVVAGFLWFCFARLKLAEWRHQVWVQLFLLWLYIFITGNEVFLSLCGVEFES